MRPLADKTTVSSTQRRLLLVAHVTAAILGLSLLRYIFWVDVHYFWVHSRAISLQHLPYRDYLWEFPPATVLLVLPARWLGVNGFATYFATMSAVATWAGARLLCRMRPDREGEIVRLWLVCGTPLCMVSWYRFDAVAVLLTCLALSAFHQGRRGAVAVTAGFATRLWPLVLTVVPGIRGRRRDVVAALGLSTIVIASWFAFSPRGFGDFLRYRQAKGYQIESVIGALGLVAGKVPHLISGAWVVQLGVIDQLDKVLTVAWFGLVIWATMRVRRVGGDPVRLAGGLVLALLVSTRIVSPQYVIWALPFVVLAAVDGDRAVARVYALAGLLTFVELWFYGPVLDRNPAALSALVVRNGLLIWCAIHELRAACATKHAFDRGLAGQIVSSPCPTPSSSGVPASTT